MHNITGNTKFLKRIMNSSRIFSQAIYGSNSVAAMITLIRGIVLMLYPWIAYA